MKSMHPVMPFSVSSTLDDRDDEMRVCFCRCSFPTVAVRPINRAKMVSRGHGMLADGCLP